MPAAPSSRYALHKLRSEYIQTRSERDVFLSDELSRDQVPGQHEEPLHPDPPAAQEAGVEEHDCQDSEPAKPIETR